jgi:hypothetical protein
MTLPSRFMHAACCLMLPIQAVTAQPTDVEKAPMTKQARPALYGVIDRSFSSIAMETRLSTVRRSLRELRVGGCEMEAGCEWIDRNGVRHSFWGDSPADMALFVKIVQVTDVGARPIGALGIGTARTQAAVLANIRRFAPGLALRCGGRASGNVGPVECSGRVGEGWVQVGFTQRGTLQAVRFDGYQAV